MKNVIRSRERIAEKAMKSRSFSANLSFISSGLSLGP
jgi:hypothetical protein